MAFKLTNSPYPKKPKRSKKAKAIEPQIDPEVFASDPYEVTSERKGFDGETWHKTGQRLSDEFESGEGYVEGLERKRYATPGGGERIVQVESSPALPQRKVYSSGAPVNPDYPHAVKGKHIPLSEQPSTEELKARRDKAKGPDDGPHPGRISNKNNPEEFKDAIKKMDKLLNPKNPLDHIFNK